MEPDREEEAPQSGEMWWGVWCRSCETFCPLVRDTSGGRTRFDMNPPPGAKLETTCPSCGVADSYAPEEVVIVRHC